MAMRGFLAITLLCVIPALVAAAACNDATEQSVNPVFHAASAKGWANLQDETEFRRFRVAHVASSVETYAAEKYSGRGVVMTVANNQEASSAHVAIQKLRAAGSNLPVELFHEGAISLAAQTELETLSGVTVHSVATSETGLMPSALLSSSFAEVLLLSARTHALVNPESVFETAEYQSSGLVMWSGLHKTSAANPIWSILNKECVDAHEQTSAAAVINKAKAWAALNMAAHLSGSFYKSLVNGDDTLLQFGAMATNTAAHTIAGSKAVGAHYTINGARHFCAHSMVLSSSASSSPMFLHSAGAELAVAGAQGAGLTCMQNVGEAEQHDEAVIADIVRLQAAVPVNTKAIAMASCTYPHISIDQVHSLVAGPSGAYYPYTLGITGNPGNSWTVNGPELISYQTICGDYFFSCSRSKSDQSDVRAFFFNISAVGRSANIRVETKLTYPAPYLSNVTLVRVIDDLNPPRRDECDLGGWTGNSYIYHNIAYGSYAIVAVAWDASYVPSPIYKIPVTVTYNGDSNAAMSSAIASLPMVIVAIFAAFVARNF